MAYALGLRLLTEPGKKVLAQAALTGVEAVTAGHGVPGHHPERLAIKEGYKVLKDEDPSRVPIETYYSIGPNPDVYRARPAKFKGGDARFQARVARVRTLDLQERVASAWHAEHLAAKQPSFAKMASRLAPARSDGAAPLRPSVDVDFGCMRMSSPAHRRMAATASERSDGATVVDEGGHVRPQRKLASASACFRLID